MVKVIWTTTAYQQLMRHCSYLKIESESDAEKVRKEIIDETDRLALTPEIFPQDMYYLNNSGDVRAFEKHSPRVSCQILQAEIRILRVRHTKRRPLIY